MPLHDHFRPPLSVRRHWHAFHNAWATYLSSALNELLPEGYFAEANVQFGIEIDVAAFEEGAPTSLSSEASGATAIKQWAPPAPAMTIPFFLAPETVEVLVYATEGGPTLAGVIELVSPANKDRTEHQQAFVSKCETYLRHGIGLVVVDIVTSRKCNLHEELLLRLGVTRSLRQTKELYAAAYRVAEREGKANLDVWHEALALGQPLPTMPLYLRGQICLGVDLEATYERTCSEQRVAV